LETITKPYGGTQEIINDIASNFYYLTTRPSVSPIIREGITIKGLKSDHLRMSVQGGPNNSTAYHAVYTDALALFRDWEVMDAIRKYCSLTSSDLLTMLETAYATVRPLVGTHGQSSGPIPFPKVVQEHDLVGLPGKRTWKPVWVNGKWPYDFWSGKLSGIPEPAGKMRVIALVDIWTQSLFLPLHKTLFKILGRIENDGTFHQEMSVHRSKAKCRKSSLAFSVDLSSATDRLPVGLQELLLNDLFSGPIGTLWRTILRRPFVQREGIGKGSDSGTILWYETGQPMGCLSSWAMLALTHHAILQYCSRQITNSNEWFLDYEILGDDLVIFNKEVYLEYIRVMELLDVGTNPSKSLVSYASQTFEFAKRTIHRGVDVSGLSWKQFISNTGIIDRIQTILYLGERGLIYREGILNRLIGAPHEAKLLDTEVSQGLMLSILSHFAHKGIVSWENAFAYILDPRERGATLFEGKVPVRMTVRDIMKMIDHLYFYKDSSPLCETELTLTNLKVRRELGASEIVPYFLAQIYRNTVARGMDFESNFHEIGHLMVKDIVPMPPGGYQFQNHLDVDLVDYAEDLAQSLAYRTPINEPVHGVFNRMVNLVNRIRDGGLTVESVLEFQDKVSQHIDRFQFLKNVNKRSSEFGTIAWLQADLYKAATVQPTHPLMEVLGDLQPNWTGRTVPPEGAVVPIPVSSEKPRVYSPSDLLESKQVWDDYRSGKYTLWEYLNWCFTGVLPDRIAAFPNAPSELDIDDYITLGMIGLACLILAGALPIYLYFTGKSVMHCFIQFAIILGFMICLYYVPSVYFGYEPKSSQTSIEKDEIPLSPAGEGHRPRPVQPNKFDKPKPYVPEDSELINLIQVLEGCLGDPELSSDDIIKIKALIKENREVLRQRGVHV
jgi:hypothetical protein